MSKLYTKEQLLKKYQNKYIKIYPHHFAKWSNKNNIYETLYEVTGISSVLMEDFNLPSDLFNE